MRQPPHLTPETPIALVHPAGACSAESLRAGWSLLQELHPTTVDLTPASPTPCPAYLAGDDRTRVDSLHRAMGLQEGAVLWAARGGFGATRLLPLVDLALLRRQRPWFVGYSDITALHLLAAREGIVSLHGPMIAEQAHATEARQSLSATLDTLRGEAPCTLQAARCLRRSAHPLTGPLIGGNLSLVASLIGTPWMPPLDGALLFLEEVGEAPYRVDRLLTTLAHHGVFQRISALLLGYFTRCALPPEGHSALDRLALEHCKAHNVPLYAGYPFGHEEPNLPLLHGATYHLAPGGSLHVASPLDLRQAPPLADSSGSAPTPTQGESAAAAAPTASAAPDAPGPGRGPVVLQAHAPEVLELLQGAFAQGAFSAAQVDVVRRGRVLVRLALGTTAHADDAVCDPVHAETAFDLASLTKALCTASLVAWARQEGVVSLHDRAPAALHPSRPTLHHLLTHTSGLPAYAPFFQEARPLVPDPSPDEVVRGGAATALLWERLAESALVAPPGTSCLYSDLGFLVAGRWLELLLERPLDTLWDEVFAGPCGWDLRFLRRPPAVGRAGVPVATERCPWRGRVLQGIVHDENAQVLRGVAGHAGLFGPALAVSAFAQSLCAAASGSPLAPMTVEDLFDPRWRVAGGRFGLGWDTPTPGGGSSAGTLLPGGSTFGHLGFTGTSLWIERQSGLSVVLLTNRVYPDRQRPAASLLRALRPALHDALMRGLT